MRPQEAYMLKANINAAALIQSCIHTNEDFLSNLQFYEIRIF